jgi:hypothetical protein
MVVDQFRKTPASFVLFFSFAKFHFLRNDEK